MSLRKFAGVVWFNEFPLSQKDVSFILNGEFSLSRDLSQLLFFYYLFWFKFTPLFRHLIWFNPFAIYDFKYKV